MKRQTVNRRTAKPCKDSKTAYDEARTKSIPIDSAFRRSTKQQVGSESKHREEESITSVLTCSPSLWPTWRGHWPLFPSLAIFLTRPLLIWTTTGTGCNIRNAEDYSGYDDVDLASEESLASSEDNDDTHLLIESPTEKELGKSPILRSQSRILPDVGDLETYSAQRQMTATQERWNALTMLPSPCFCMFYLLSGAWIRNYETPYAADSFDDIDLTKCLLPSSSWWHNMPSLPPIPVVCVALGIILHAPFSILYHWRYAHRLSGLARTTHWSRRLDQIMIHVASTALTYASSGSWDLLVANVLFNADCVYRQCMPVVEPRRNQMRITISILAYLIPILHRGLVLCFAKLLCLGMIGFWLFTRYPIGGWSHAVFHLVMGLSPPLVMEVALTLEASQPAMQQAAACVANY
jgi:hypothetical protein